MSISISDFAEQLMAEEASPSSKVATVTPTASHYSNVVGQQAPDISDVVIPDDMISSLVESTTGVKTEVVEEIVTEGEIAEPKVEQDILLEIRDLLLGLRTQITEMTTVGAIGTGGTASTKTSTEDKIKNILKKKRKK